jgi:hypothetical protein
MVSPQLGPEWWSASRYKVSVAYGIEPEARCEYFAEEKLPGCHGRDATDEEDHTLDDLAVVELAKAADER